LKTDPAAGVVEIWLDNVYVADLSGTGLNTGSAPVGSMQIGEVQSGRTYDVTFNDAAFWADTPRFSRPRVRTWTCPVWLNWAARERSNRAMTRPRMRSPCTRHPGNRSSLRSCRVGLTGDDLLNEPGPADIFFKFLDTNS